MENKREGSKNKVMVVIDESEYSYYALIWTLDNLREYLAGSQLFLFAPQPLPIFNSTIVAAPLGICRLYCHVPYNLTISFQEKNKKVVTGLLEKAKKICASRGIKAEATTEVGETKEVIRNAVENYKINMLVIGNHDVGFLKRYFQEGVNSYCLSNVKCHVLHVNKPEKNASINGSPSGPFS